MFKTKTIEQIKHFINFIAYIGLTILAFNYHNIVGLILGITGIIMSLISFYIILINFKKLERLLLILSALWLIFILIIKTLI